jgi:predicted O-methyltransferase YrrM
MIDRATMAKYPSNATLLDLVKSGSFAHRGKKWPIKYSTPTAICQRYGEIILEKRLRRGVEIGTLFGLSTMYLAEALQRNEGHLDTIDIRYEKREWAPGEEIENIHEVAERLVDDGGFRSTVSFHVGHSNSVLASFIEQGRSYDFALIDGSHLFPAAMLDFIFVDRILEDGGIVALDDIGEGMARKYPDGGPNRMLEMIFASGRYRITPLNLNVVICEKLRTL